MEIVFVCLAVAIWSFAMVAATIPAIGIWVYIRILAVFPKIQNFFEITR